VKPISFPQSNRTLNKPSDMTDEECLPLPIYTDGEHCISLWEPSFRERLSVLFRGRVWLWVKNGSNQPPVLIDTADPWKGGA